MSARALTAAALGLTSSVALLSGLLLAPHLPEVMPASQHSLRPSLIDRGRSISASPVQTLVIGLGSGRCGTHSLSRLLSLQANASVSHEFSADHDAGRSELRWHPNTEDIRHLDRLLAAKLEGAHGLVGDVAYYLLPYADHIARAFKSRVAVRFVVLRRNELDTVDSWDRFIDSDFWTEAGRQRLARTHSRKRVQRAETFPSYQNCSKREALSCWWRDYYEAARGLAGRWPSLVREFEMERLFGNTSAVEELLTFLGRAHPFVIPAQEDVWLRGRHAARQGAAVLRRKRPDNNLLDGSAVRGISEHGGFPRQRDEEQVNLRASPGVGLTPSDDLGAATALISACQCYRRDYTVASFNLHAAAADA